MYLECLCVGIARQIRGESKGHERYLRKRTTLETREKLGSWFATPIDWLSDNKFVTMRMIYQVFLAYECSKLSLRCDCNFSKVQKHFINVNRDNTEALQISKYRTKIGMKGTKGANHGVVFEVKRKGKPSCLCPAIWCQVRYEPYHGCSAHYVKG